MFCNGKNFGNASSVARRPFPTVASRLALPLLAAFPAFFKNTPRRANENANTNGLASSKRSKTTLLPQSTRASLPASPLSCVLPSLPANANSCGKVDPSLCSPSPPTPLTSPTSLLLPVRTPSLQRVPMTNLTTLNDDELLTVVGCFKFDPLTLGRISQVSTQCRTVAALARENVAFGALGLRPKMLSWELKARFGVESVGAMRKFAPNAVYMYQTSDVISKMLVEYGGWDALYKRAVAHAPAVEKLLATTRSKIESLLTRRCQIDDLFTRDYAEQTGQWMARNKSAVASLEEWEKEYSSELNTSWGEGKRLYRYLNRRVITIPQMRLAEAVDQMRRLQADAVTRYTTERANVTRVRCLFVDRLKAANCQTMDDALAWFDYRPSMHVQVAVYSTDGHALESAVLTDDGARAAARHLADVWWPSHVAISAELKAFKP